MIRLVIPDIHEADIEAAAAVLRSGYLVQGRHVLDFERRVADYIGVRHAVAVSSGTAALHLALLALDIGPGDEVLLPDLTMPATANVVIRVGATPVLVDIDPATLNVDPAELRQALTPRTKALMPVHLFGLPADMDPILELAHAHNLPVIEDAACALGAEYGERRCGSLGRLACFSFHPRKVITTGEGGMVTTDDDALAERLQSWRNHGIAQRGGQTYFARAGLNYRLTDFQAALGTGQMDRLSAILQHRRALAAVYQEALANCPCVVCPTVPPACRTNWQAYVVMLPDGIDRDAIQRRLRDRDIETTLGTYACSAQPAYADYTRPCPHARHAYRQSLALPLHGRMTEAEVRTVAQCLHTLVGA